MAVTTDLIAGFPGETEDEHHRSLEVVRAAAFAGAHVFAFSPRPGTEAASMPGGVPAPVRARRARELKAEVAVGAAAFRRAAIGGEADVLWERRGANDPAPPGLTDNYLNVFARGFTPAPNDLSRVLLSREIPEGLEAVPVPSPDELPRPTARPSST